MRHLFEILAVVFLICGCQRDISRKSKYSDNELQLLKGNSSLTVNFDFGLDKNEQFENLQSQVEINLCNAVVPLNGRFALPTLDTINILIFAERYCENDETNRDQPCVLTRSLRIFINKDSQILFEEKLTSLDSLSQKIAKSSKDFFINNQFEYAIYNLDWDKETPNEFKKLVFGHIIDGYLLAANNYSLTDFQKDLCTLDSVDIIKIARNFKMVIGLEDERSPIPPPPPPQYELIKID